MKAVVLAGGFGTRLEPFTIYTQKQLLPVANIPVLHHAIEGLVDSGITEIAVIVGGRHPEKVTQYIDTHFPSGPEIECIFQGEPKGLAHAVKMSEDFIGGSEFVVYFGDTIIEKEIIESVVEGLESQNGSGFIPFQEVSDPSRFGIAELEGGELIGLIEKPQTPPSSLAYMGIMGFTPDIFPCIEEINPSDRGELELTDAIDRLVKSKPISWDQFSGIWIDVGTPDDMLKANQILLNRERREERVESDAGTQPMESRTEINTSDIEIVEPVSIGKNVEISEGARVGPNVSIGDDCSVKRVELENSIVLEGAHIDSPATISDSIIGHNTLIEDVQEDGMMLLGPSSTLRM